MANPPRANETALFRLVLLLGLPIVGALSAVVYWPVSLGLLIGSLLHRGVLVLLSALFGLLGVVAYLRTGNPPTAEGFTLWTSTRLLAHTDLAILALKTLLTGTEAGIPTNDALWPILAEIRPLGTASLPLFFLCVPVGTVLIRLARTARRGSSGASQPSSTGDHPPSTFHASPRSPQKGETGAVWTLDGGLPPGLGDAAVSWLHSQGRIWWFRYRVAQVGIFQWGGSPRYRVLHGKGGVGALFTRFRGAVLHGNAPISQVSTRFWGDSYTVAPRTRWERVLHAYQGIHGGRLRQIHGNPHRYQISPTLYAPVWSTITPNTPNRVKSRRFGAIWGWIGGIQTAERLAEQTILGVDSPQNGHRRAESGTSEPKTEPKTPHLPVSSDRSPVHGADTGDTRCHTRCQLPEPGQWGIHGAGTGSVETLMAPPKSGKTRLCVPLVRAILDGAPFLGEPCGRSGVVWFTEESAETFAGKRRSVLAASDSGYREETRGAQDATGPTTLPVGEADGGAAGRSRAARLVCVYGPGEPTGLLPLCLYLAECVQWCRFREIVTGDPWRTIVLDSLFFWCPEAEYDVQAAGRVMALFKSVAGLGYRVLLVTHADPESGKQKGPQQLWRQTDYRIHLQPEPHGTPVEQTNGRRLVLTGRYDDDTRPSDRCYTLDGGELVPLADGAAPEVRGVPEVPDAGTSAGRPIAPKSRKSRPVDRLLAALPPDGTLVALQDVRVDGWQSSRTYDVAKEAESLQLARRETIGGRGKLGIRRILPESPQHATS